MDDLLEQASLEARLRRHVETLARTPRPPGTTAHRQAREYIRAHLGSAGFSIREESYRMGVLGSGINVLTDPRPDQPDLPLVIVGAHYDSTPDTPGADDNASAVAALLELAAWIRPRLQQAADWRARLLLAAYDQEEDGLVGSRVHAQTLTAPVTCMISLEMLGYIDRRPDSQHLPPGLAGLYPSIGDFIGVVGNEPARGQVETVARAMRSVEGLPVEMLVVPGDGSILPESRLSDHASFWDRGLPGIMVTDTSFFRNPHYHQATDTPETLDYPFLALVTAGVCRAVEALLRG